MLIEKIEVSGLGAAIRGMRNPMNSWKNIDSEELLCEYNCDLDALDTCPYKDRCDDMENKTFYSIGKNDYELMKKLVSAGTDHSKFMRMIHAQFDITAPMYWWKEMDTYKVGTVRNSCSTMHKIHANVFKLSDFSFDNIVVEKNTAGAVNTEWMLRTIDALNYNRGMYLTTKDKDYWYTMIQMLPSSYNQKATLDLNYQVLRTIYHSDRRKHKLNEWHDFIRFIETLPYSELITMDSYQESELKRLRAELAEMNKKIAEMEKKP